MSAHELKGLQVRAAAAHAEIKQKIEAKSLLDREIAEKKKHLAGIDAQIRLLTAKEPTVSEHAILRYAERVVGLDVAAIRSAILTDANKKAIIFAGSCKIKSGGLEFVVKDRVVVTVAGETVA